MKLHLFRSSSDDSSGILHLPSSTSRTRDQQSSPLDPEGGRSLAARGAAAEGFLGTPIETTGAQLYGPDGRRWLVCIPELNMLTIFLFSLFSHFLDFSLLPFSCQSLLLVSLRFVSFFRHVSAFELLLAFAYPRSLQIL